MDACEPTRPNRPSQSTFLNQPVPIDLSRLTRPNRLVPSSISDRVAVLFFSHLLQCSLCLTVSISAVPNQHFCIHSIRERRMASMANAVLYWPNVRITEMTRADRLGSGWSDAIAMPQALVIRQKHVPLYRLRQRCRLIASQYHESGAMTTRHFELDLSMAHSLFALP
jgi:hypothetical protein